MLTLNTAQFSQMASRTLGMVLHATCDMNAGSLNYQKLDALREIDRGSVDELRYSGSVMMVAADEIAERDGLRAVMALLDLTMDDDHTLGAEIILFDKGEVVARVISVGTEPSDLL